MVLVAIVGELGAGKTLGLTHVLKKRYDEGKTIYANYHLNNDVFDNYEYVESTDQINEMREGVFGGDELWLWLDSRESARGKNKFISSILIKSRKRDIDILYTTQNFMQIDIRIRRVTDFVIEPILTKNELVCKLFYYKMQNYLAGSTRPIKILKFYTPPVWKMYDTKEEVKGLED